MLHVGGQLTQAGLQVCWGSGLAVLWRLVLCLPGKVFLLPDERRTWAPAGRSAPGAVLPQAVGLEVQVYVAVTDVFKCYIVPRCLTLPMFGPLKKTEFCTSCFIILEMYI